METTSSMESKNTFVSPLGPLFLRDDITIPEFMTRYNPDNVSHDKVVHIDTITGKSLTYGGLRTEAAKCAWGLQNILDLKEGAVIALLCPSSSDFILLSHATWWAGGVISPINTSSSKKDITFALNIIRPTHVAVAGQYLKSTKEALQNTDMAKEGILPVVFTIIDRVEGLQKFPEDIVGRRPNQILPPYSLNGRSSKDVASLICFSSGTTGAMKGVMLSHYNLIINTLQYRVSVPALHHSGQREVWFTPYCHVYGFATVVVQGMWFANFTCALSAFDLKLFLEKMVEYKATWAHLVPPIALLLAQAKNLDQYDLSSLKYVCTAAAALKKDLQVRLISKFPGTSICQGYGLSECSPAVMYQHPTDGDRVGSCGKLVSGTEARLVDPMTGETVGPGREGELWIRGPQVMMGYAGNEEATRNTFTGSWLRTGDIMKMDEQGNFYVTDRLKEMIKYKGLHHDRFQIAPSEMEDLLLGHPHVTDAAVCAVYDNAQATEVPLAYVSLVEEHAQSSHTDIQLVLKGIRSWVDGQVAGYKKLRGGVFHLQTLPKSNTGKIMRKNLPAKLKEQRETRL